MSLEINRCLVRADTGPMFLVLGSRLFILKRRHRRKEEIGGASEGLFHDREVHTDQRGGDLGAHEICLETSEGLSCGRRSWFLLCGTRTTNAAVNPVTIPARKRPFHIFGALKVGTLGGNEFPYLEISKHLFISSFIQQAHAISNTDEDLP